MSPVDGRSSSMELEQLLNTLADPFTTKKQLPRTPESLRKFPSQFLKGISNSIGMIFKNDAHANQTYTGILVRYRKPFIDLTISFSFL